MPVITCPKCQGKLKFPDDSPARRVKCPTCGNVFMSSDGLDPKNPESTAPEGKRGSKADVDLDRRRDDDDDRDRGKRRRDDDDDRDRDDDRERGRSRRRDDDDDDDRDRKKRRRDEDDDDRDRGRSRRDDDDDDRDRGRRRRRDDEDDEDDDRDDDRGRDRGRSRRRPKQNVDGQYNRASLSCLLNFIGGWLQVGGLAIVALVTFLVWVGVTDGMKFFSIIAGLLGIGCWLTSCVGYGIGIAGPRDKGALGFSIALACTAAVHLLFTIVVAVSREYHSGVFGGPVGSTVEVAWPRFVTSNDSLSSFLFALVTIPFAVIERAMGSAILGILTNLAEVARSLLLLFWLRSVMRSVRNNRAADSCMKSIIIYAIGVGAVVLLGLFFGALFSAMTPSKGTAGDFKAMMAIARIYQIITTLAILGLAVWVNIVVKSMKGNIDYRR